jgi:hypothetical protein
MASQNQHSSVHINIVACSFYCPETSQNFVWIVLTICDAFPVPTQVHSRHAVQLVSLYMKVFICLSSTCLYSLASNNKQPWMILFYLFFLPWQSWQVLQQVQMAYWATVNLRGGISVCKSLAEVCSWHWTKFQCCRCCRIEPSLVSRIQNLQIAMAIYASLGTDCNIKVEEQSTIKIQK